MIYNEKDNPITEIVYSAQNVTYDTSGGQVYLSMDVFAVDSPAGLLYSQSNIVIQYDSTVFGSHLVSSGNITASKGAVIDSPFYSIALSDSTANILKIAITHSDSASSLPTLGSNQQLCHLRIKVSGFNDTAVALAFDTIAMAGRSEYKRSVSGLEFPYEIVRVSGLVGALRDVESITYTVKNFLVDAVADTIAFDISADDGVGGQYASGAIFINYDTLAFGSYISGYVTATLGSLNTFIYSIGLNDAASNILEVDISNPLQAAFNNLPTIVAHLVLSFSYPACLNTAGISGNDTLTSNNAAASTFYSQIDQTVEPYSTADASGSYNSVLCPVLNPHVDHLSSDCIGAGTFDTLTIFGSNFGTDQGSVWFTSAGASGGFFQAYYRNILLWTPTQIEMYVPSYPLTAGSGNFYIQTAAGLNNAEDSEKINIGYAIANEWNGYDSTAQLLFRMDTAFVFKLDTTLWNTPGVIATVQHVMADMNCQMGVNFSLDTTGPSAIHTISPNYLNLISIQPNSYDPFMANPQSLAFTSVDQITSPCLHNLPEYNNIARCTYQLDVSFRAVPIYGGTWNWSDANTPSATQYDFATILAHELGHAAMLDHNKPFYTGDVMAPIVQKGYVLRNYDSDPNDIEGVYRSLNLGSIVGAAGGCGYATQVFSGTCSHLAYACTPSYPDLGISSVATTPSFSAWLFPNPYQGNTVVHVDVLGYGDYTIAVYDVIGQQVWEQHISTGTSFDVPLSGFQQSTGLYLVQVSDTRSRVIIKMIKL